MITTVLRDLRQTWRSLRRTPTLSLAAFACIAIGIGAVVSAFALLDGALLRRLPYPDPERLVRVWATRDHDVRRDLSYLNYLDLREGARTLDRLEATARLRMSVVYGDATERTRGEAVTPGYFELIGVQPVLGRLFAPSEYEPASPDLALISHELWETRFGRDPGVVGRSLLARAAWSGAEASNRPIEILGVLPPGFVGTIEEDQSHFWVPIVKFQPAASLERRTQRILWTLGRLAPRAGLAAAQQEVENLGRALAQQFPDDNEGVGARVEPLGENWRSELRQGLVLLLGAAVLLLLIAGANIVNLLLARVAARRQEIDTRVVLGAGRGRLVGWLLGESMLLTALGGAAGVALAALFVRLCVAAAGEDIPGYVEIGIDWRVIAASLAVVLVTGAAAGLLPALLGSRTNPAARLREAGRGTSSSGRQVRLGNLLVAAEVALTVVLVVAASLMARSYHNLKTEDLGYRTEQLLRLTASVDRSAFPEGTDWLELARRAKQQLASYPGVAGVSVMGGILPPYEDVTVTLYSERVSGNLLEGIDRHTIDEHFLETLDVRLLHGRSIEERDRDGATRVAVVSRDLARALAGGDERAALGSSFQMARQGNREDLTEPYEIVGIVENMLYTGPLGTRQHDRDLFLSLYQVPDWLLSFAVHTRGDAGRLERDLTAELARVVQPSPVHWVSTMEYELGRQYSDSRFYALLITLFSGSAVLLAMIGVYGVLANSVGRRLQEIGVRVAVGADPAAVLRLVLGQSLRVVAVGLVAGVAVALLTTRVLSSLLYGIGSHDLPTYLAVVACLVLLALVASYLPARRAIKLDPVVALREG